ncbi:uncharacterized protein LOC125421387 [Ziziphus jujuba]|uniref:Uncharacterized protein LOC125421387 n=2 Tax=Ziziphus jujuba TaxID=326968 RepID=A0ABM3IDQ7_ZIZJJ|nr:uncharacterized protein LOC125421387 [Ziziphus jujuba]KAH7538023.1 hypothetical protein FEM48_Zijuj03G0155400 [Ziziphus jujuba var. spinosa]
MASKFVFITLAVAALALSLCVQGTLGGTTCEQLDQDTCAFAVSSSGKRCVLEKHVKRSGQEVYSCRTSDIEADNKLNDWIETEQCIKACGLDRKTFGISTDSLLESTFTQKLCSPQCYDNCPNIVDLHFNLAAGEGVFLPKLCEAQGSNARRQMAELRSSGLVAPGPAKHGVKLAAAPIVSAEPPFSI